MQIVLKVKYHFSQRFAVSAQKAFDWCINFDPKDYVLMGDENAERQIIQIALRHIYPRRHFPFKRRNRRDAKACTSLSTEILWTSIHLTGPTKYSQFLYKITVKGKDASELNFTAAHIEYDEKTNSKLIPERLCKEI